MNVNYLPLILFYAFLCSCNVSKKATPNNNDESPVIVGEMDAGEVDAREPIPPKKVTLAILEDTIRLPDKYTSVWLTRLDSGDLHLFCNIESQDAFSEMDQIVSTLTKIGLKVKEGHLSYSQLLNSPVRSRVILTYNSRLHIRQLIESLKNYSHIFAAVGIKKIRTGINIYDDRKIMKKFNSRVNQLSVEYCNGFSSQFAVRGFDENESNFEHFFEENHLIQNNSGWLEIYRDRMIPVYKNVAGIRYITICR